MKNFILLCSIIIISCNDSGLNYQFQEIDKDFSHIENPKERWKAYKLDNYVIEQTWTCECSPPRGSVNYIIKGKIDKVEFMESPGSQLSPDYEWARTRVISIDEAFDLIESYESEAHSVRVEYHQKYGYPTDLNIDIYEIVADEEIHYDFSNLKAIRN